MRAQKILMAMIIEQHFHSFMLNNLLLLDDPWPSSLSDHSNKPKQLFLIPPILTLHKRTKNKKYSQKNWQHNRKLKLNILLTENIARHCREMNEKRKKMLKD